MTASRDVAARLLEAVMGPSWTKNTPLQVGFHPPEQCARGRDDCRSLHQIVSSGEKPTFICCGEVKPGCSPVPQDKWSFCMGMTNAPHGKGYDFRAFIDRRDMAHMSGVLASSLAGIMLPDEIEGSQADG